MKTVSGEFSQFDSDVYPVHIARELLIGTAPSCCIENSTAGS